MHKLRIPFPLELCALLFLLLCCESFAQAGETTTPPWIAGSVEADIPQNLSQIASSSEAYFDQQGRGPHRGYKHYRRWLWFAQQRLDGQGLLKNNGGAEEAACLERSITKSAVGWQSLGPTSFGLAPGSGFNGGLGRVNDLTVGPAGALLVATSTGGLWLRAPRTDWRPLTNQEVPVPALSAVVLDPQSPDTVYILTGDGDGRYAASNGVLMSTDAGETWQPIGPDFGGQVVYGYDLAISRLAGGQVVLFAATTSGVYRAQGDAAQWTQGAPWELVLRPNAAGGYFEVVLHPTEPSTVYAAGVDSVWKSTDGGASSGWVMLGAGAGLPSGEGTQRVALAVTPAAPDNLYAVYGGSVGYQGVYVSTDRGGSFNLRSNSPNILGYEPDGTSFLGSGLPWYVLTIAVSPTDPQRVRVGSQNVWESNDGGVNWQLTSYWDGRDRRYTLAGFIHNDIHEIVDLGSTLYVASDGGVTTSSDGGQTWQDQSAGLNITQIYTISSTPQAKNVVYFAAQDNGSSVLSGGVATQQVDYDGTAFLVDPNDPQKMFIGFQFGGLFKSRPRPAGSVTKLLDAMPPLSSPTTTSYVTPLVMDPQSRLFGCYVDLWRSVDGATSWTNLTDGATGSDVCSALAVTADALYVVKGTSWLTTVPGFATIYRYMNGVWSDITNNLTGKVYWISDVVADPRKALNAWVSATGYGIPNVYAISGDVWTPVTNGLPAVPIYSLAYDAKAGVLYAGSTCGVYRLDDPTDPAANWSLVSNGMPRMQVMDLEIQEYPDGARVLYAATLAQGAWRLQLLSAGGT